MVLVCSKCGAATRPPAQRCAACRRPLGLRRGLLGRLTLRRGWCREWTVELPEGRGRIEYDGRNQYAEFVRVDGVEVVRRTGSGGIHRRYEFPLGQRMVALSVGVTRLHVQPILGRLNFISLEIDGEAVYREGTSPRHPLPVSRNAAAFLGSSGVNGISRTSQGRQRHPRARTVVRSMMAILALVAATGLVLSAALHVAALVGRDIEAEYPGVLWLHIGVIAVGGLTIAGANWLDPLPRDKQRSLCGAPGWMIALAGAAILYAVAGMGCFMSRYEGQATRRADGTFALEEHGKIVRRIDEVEFQRQRAREQSGESSAWIAGYAALATLSYGAWRTSQPICMHPDGPETQTESPRS